MGRRLDKGQIIVTLFCDGYFEKILFVKNDVYNVVFYDYLAIFAFVIIFVFGKIEKS